MTTSGSTSIGTQTLTLITEAFALLRVGTAEEPLEVTETDEAIRSLNMIIKELQIDGLHLWTKSEGVLFLTAGQAYYDLGGGNADRSCLLSDFVQTTLTADKAALATAMTVASITGIAAADYVGVELDDGTMQWTTVNGAPSGSTVTLTTGLTSAASSGNAMFSFTTKLKRPSRLLAARRHIYDANTDIPLTLLERPDYFDQPVKTNQATPTLLYYDPQLSFGRIYFWSAPSSVLDTVQFTFERPLEIQDTLINTFDFPDEWMGALSLMLADRLAWKYSFPLQERVILKSEARDARMRLLAWDKEYASVQFQPDFTWGGGFCADY